MSIARRIVQALFWTFLLAVLISRALSTGINHDENQFISPGQLLVANGLLPYRNYPYTHMPYAIPFYALAAGLSSYDYLAARILGALAWFACAVLIVAISRLIGEHLVSASQRQRTWAPLLGEFAIMAIFVYHPLSIGLMGSALNHSFATLFSLVAFMLLLRGAFGRMRLSRAAFWSGACVAAAGFTRFNYASLIVVTALFWLVYPLCFERSLLRRLVGRFFGGVLAASLPALLLALTAPAAFFYGNIVYIRLNTAYYRAILYGETMDAASKLHEFLRTAAANPIDIVLYALVALAALAFLARFVRRRSLPHLVGLTIAAFSGAMFLTAFSPTPMQVQYLFAPLPFMLLFVALLGWMLFQRNALAYLLAMLMLVAIFLIRPIRPGLLVQLDVLTHPSTWTPLQIHDFAESLSSERHVPPGRILTILPMVTADAGYDSYPFTATGPFSWRTSLLLSPERRKAYGVTSPAELPALLDESPPVAVLTGLETPKAAFTASDPGGLERPFIDFAEKHGYQPTTLSSAFLPQPLTLWVRPP